MARASEGTDKYLETEKETICKMSFVHDVCFDHREKIQNIKITRVTT